VIIDNECCREEDNQQELHKATEGNKMYTWLRCSECGNISLESERIDTD